MIKRKYSRHDSRQWIKGTVVVLMGLLVLWVNGCKNQQRSTPQPTIRILTFGDSITRGVREGIKETQTFTYYLGVFLNNHNLHVELIKKGISGETTSGALNRIDHDVIREKPHYVTIMYGTNDAFIDGYANEAGHWPRIPIEKYKKNLQAMVQKLKANNIKPILMTPIPMGRFWGSDVGIYKQKGINFKLKKYVEVVRDTAENENVPLVDHFDEWLTWKKRGKDINLWMTDGIHPNPKGHRLMALTIFKVLKKEF
ncbi:MAG: GDSL-type esterase/lipase family protein [Candidatus Aminicenantes bacterium]|jgi:lysophospholipase L1-like esterase